MIEKTPDILALILAGGLSRRMEGAAKPLLRLGGRRLIDWAIEKARAQCGAVALNLHDDAPETTAPFADLGLAIAPDAAPGRLGPLAGVLGGLDFAARHDPGAEFVLSLPCDSPFLPDDLAQRLRDAASETRSGLACAASGGRVHHVVALWPLRLREDLRRALLERDMRAVGQFQRAYDAAIVDWPAAARDPFFNVNTPDDLARAEMLMGKA
ncbi:molybdenum cofactor guanylyltransferase [Rhodoblastus acidophilus]|uniref:Molybdenum cofactor guanylyltransferase n=1 Tax=Candidatus Rhodoblastus alkanivorans TaxID=2954117 RepID=A0ABS9Z8R0_9HYPH|nr:molybdenum cofactor guanylyltransferase MobA [Candidatus Rhodoblastus alkanivorans]MCI4680555.1 molybdenum cofactor guanylyltransferase [Candidatus Rhodoblastus alkanivorans]MCI4683982.1 molybdenum cofactor guanylyltransferase [Candidatus Rhodoblastus alkanivorans]MDI4641301.1 molybdenum cofactor guanylyltransferase [Rhodoblastus acidophilus]